MQLFPPWHIGDWETVDDRVRGGSSISELRQPSGDEGVVFCGTLGEVSAHVNPNTTTLGGAGFASQRYRFSDLLRLPKSQYKGIRIALRSHRSLSRNPDEFTLVLHTTPITYRPDGRVQSRVSWEAAFTGGLSTIELPFESFQATYRGRPIESPATFDPSTIYDLSLMCRSAFGKQAGRFEICILGLEAVEK